MLPQFRAEVFQKQRLTAGTHEVHAIITITRSESSDAQSQSDRLIGVLCDVSGSMEGAKIEAAKAAMAGLVNELPAGCELFLIAGADEAYLICPVVRAETYSKQQALRAIQHVRAFGGTRISNWLRLALDQFHARDATVRQVFLLTDGQNDAADRQALQAALASCEGVFQCDCRGIGVDWQADQLRTVANRLHGTVGTIASPQQIAGELRAFLQKSLARTAADMSLRLWTPQGARVKFCKQTHPSIVDLRSRAREISSQVCEYPTGVWSRGETRDYHVCVEVSTGEAGEEILACRASLLLKDRSPEVKVGEARVLATWADARSAFSEVPRQRALA